MANQTQAHKSKRPLNKQTAPGRRRQRAATRKSDTALVHRLLDHPASANTREIRALQRTVGNQATTRLIQAKLRVGPAGDRYEREADRVAREVTTIPDASTRSPVQRQEEEEEVQAKRASPTITPLVQHKEEEEELQTKSRGKSGFTVTAQTEKRLKSLDGAGKPLSKEMRRFMEPRFGTDFGGVRVHSGGDAVQLNRDLNAKAFTHGRDIYFGAGAYAPETDTGKRLLAHELTHVVQQTGSAQRKPQSSEVLQAKLKGSTAALVAVSNHGKQWHNILNALSGYEALETAQVQRLLTFKRLKEQDQVMKQYSKEHAKTIAKSTLEEQRKINKHFDELFTKLKNIRQQVVKWINRSKHQKSTEERTHQRMAALKMLLPRIEKELDDIASGKFEETVASGNLTVIKFEAVGGQLNKLDLVKVGGIEGFFTEDRPKLTAQDLEGPAASLGIPTEDPHLGARSVAMYRLDQLLGINMLAKTEFAVSQRRDSSGKITEKMGVFMEKAKGEKAEALAKGGRLAEDDALLQSALNKLQMLDIICGQVDRHMGNYYINMSDGRVTGVQGIDNDMSFGVAHTDLDKSPGGIHYKGIPPLVDSATAKRILTVRESDIENALKGLLSPSEVTNTVNRLKKFQAELQKMQAKNLFVDNWGTPETTKTLREGKESYASIAMEISGAAQIKQALVEGGYLEILKPIAKTRYESAYKSVEEMGSEEAYKKQMLEMGGDPTIPTLEGITETTLSGTATGLWEGYVKSGKMTLDEALTVARRTGRDMKPGEDVMPFFEKALSATTTEKKAT